MKKIEAIGSFNLHKRIEVQLKATNLSIKFKMTYLIFYQCVKKVNLKYSEYRALRSIKKT